MLDCTAPLGRLSCGNGLQMLSAYKVSSLSWIVRIISRDEVNHLLDGMKEYRNEYLNDVRAHILCLLLSF